MDDTNLTINELTERMHALVKSKGWYEADSKRPQTPRWFAQGPQYKVILYLHYLARGETRLAEIAWACLRYSRFKAVVFRNTLAEQQEFSESAFQAAIADPQVAAIVLRIYSPGGTVTASDIAYLEVRRFAERTGKPVVVSLGDVAASGGYYLALAGDEIIAQPTSLTGSIGVVIPLMNFSEGLGRLGIVSTAITSGPNKDMGNPFEAREAAHEALYQGLVDEFYSRFRGLVESRRGGIPPGSLEAATDGRIMTGVRALEWGLVDSLGGIAEAVVSVKRRAGLTHADVVKYSGSVGRTRSAYAEGWSTPVEAPASPAVEVNVLNLGRGPGSMPNAYYLWTGPG